MTYDEQYAKVDAVFGAEAEDILKQFSDRLKPGSPVLDIGAGQGRNSLFLAQRGLTVHALEPSSVAAIPLKQAAEKEHLPMEVFPCTLESFDPPVRSYSGILVFGLIPDLDWTAIRALTAKIEDLSEPGTLLWVTGFTTEDPAYAHHKDSWTETGKNSFKSSEGRVRTYLEPGRILKLFEKHTVLHHWEGMGPEHRHGDALPERHGRFEAVLRV